MADVDYTLTLKLSGADSEAVVITLTGVFEQNDELPEDALRGAEPCLIIVDKRDHIEVRYGNRDGRNLIDLRFAEKPPDIG